MATTPDYYITGVWKSDVVITDVFLHKVTASNHFAQGIKKTVKTVIALVEAGSWIMTLKWNYQTERRRPGARIEVVTEFFSKYLRTVKDATVQDNLDNMINMVGFV